jgi:hypothetical protein
MWLLVGLNSTIVKRVHLPIYIHMSKGYIEGSIFILNTVQY